MLITFLREIGDGHLLRANGLCSKAWDMIATIYKSNCYSIIVICLAAVTADVAVAAAAHHLLTGVEDAHLQDTPNSTLFKEMWMTSSTSKSCASA